MTDLDARLQAARKLAQLEPSQANREAVKAAWAACEAAAPARKPAMVQFACRAGKRQAAERLAMTTHRRHF